MAAIGSAAPKSPVNEVWARRLALGLPALVLALVLVVANQIGGILIAQDLRADYAALVDEAAAPSSGAGGGPPRPPTSVPPSTSP